MLLDGAKYKFKQSVREACFQCCRAAKHIREDNRPTFNGIEVDRTKPIYKIAVTFTHYSSLVGHVDQLINAGLLEEKHRDTWIVSLWEVQK